MTILALRIRLHAPWVPFAERKEDGCEKPACKTAE